MSGAIRVAHTQRDIWVLRRRGAPVVGIIGIVGIAAMGVVVFPLAVAKNTTLELLTLGSLLASVMRVTWRALVRPRVEIHAQTLEVVGLGNRYSIALESIQRLDSSDGLSIWTVHGEEISVFAFSGSLIDRGRTTSEAADEIRRVLPRKRPPKEIAKVARRAVDWTWMDLVFVPFVILLVVGVILEN